MLKFIWQFTVFAWFCITLIYVWENDIASAWLSANCVFLSLVIIHIINEEIG